MSNRQGSARNLSQGGQEAFRALVNSVAPEVTVGKDGKLAPEVLEVLSAKLKGLVGEDAVKDFEHRRNERGELVNEEGLPVIDISEPLPQSDVKDLENNYIIQDVPLINLSSLPSVAKEKLRLHRGQILDTLEAEEYQEHERQDRAEREEREEILRKRREEAVNEKARLQKAKELQKKMGKALMGYADKDGDRPPKEGGPEKKASTQTEKGSEARKKTVTFVETGDSSSDARKSEWGVVTAARLRSSQRPTLLQGRLSDGNPVKLNVVERKPSGQSFPISSRPTPFAPKDSDDESEPEGNQLHLTSDDERDEPLKEPLNSEEEDDDGELELENEYDLDYAQHQREVALEYYKKRNIIGQDTAKAMMDHTHEGNGPEVPVSNNQPKPSISHFKANRIVSAYGASTRNASSTSLADSVLPESTARTIQHAVRSGRIDDNSRLVGGEHDSDSENETEGLQEALELLKEGEIYNLGQNGHYLYSTPPQHKATPASATSLANPSAVPPGAYALEESQNPPLAPLNRPKASKFKVDRSQAGRPSLTPPSVTSTPPTLISNFQRSSSKPPNTLAETIIEEKRHQGKDALEAAHPAHISPLSNSPSPSPMIIESPSFRAPRPAQPQMNPSAALSIPAVIESPSFPSWSRSQPDGGNGLPPMIVDSPSFPPPDQRLRRPDHPPTVVASQRVASGTTNKPVVNKLAATPATVLSPPGPIVASTVQERITPASRTHEGSTQGNGPSSVPAKVSRFKQTRDTQS